MSQSKLLAEYESMLQLTTGQTLSPLETSEQVLEALDDGSTVVLSLSDGGEDALLTAERVLDDRILFVNPRKTQGARPGQELPAAGPLPPRRAEPDGRESISSKFLHALLTTGIARAHLIAE